MAAPMMHQQQSFGAPAEAPPAPQHAQHGYVAPQQAPAPQLQSYAPQAQPQYVPATGTAPAVGAVSGRGTPQDWKVGFFDCFTPGETCCLGFWCPCVLFGKTQQRIKDPSMGSYETFDGNCLGFGALCACCCGFSFVFSMIKRSEMRNHYNLDGSGLGDFLRAYCCQCCSLIQEEKEALLRNAEMGHGAGTAAVASVPGGYQKESSTMSYGVAQKM